MISLEQIKALKRTENTIEFENQETGEGFLEHTFTFGQWSFKIWFNGIIIDSFKTPLAVEKRLNKLSVKHELKLI